MLYEPSDSVGTALEACLQSSRDHFASSRNCQHEIIIDSSQLVRSGALHLTHNAYVDFETMNSNKRNDVVTIAFS